MSGEYPTKSLDAMTVLSEAATALREVTRPVSTGSSFVEKNATGLCLPPFLVNCLWERLVRVG